jgi:hypothetical protein
MASSPLIEKKLPFTDNLFNSFYQSATVFLDMNLRPSLANDRENWDRLGHKRSEGLPNASNVKLRVPRKVLKLPHSSLGVDQYKLQ